MGVRQDLTTKDSKDSKVFLKVPFEFSFEPLVSLVVKSLTFPNPGVSL